VVVVGEQDPFAEQLCAQGLDRFGIDGGLECEGGWAVAGQGDGDDPVQPAGLEDPGDLAFDRLPGFAGLSAGRDGR
jgi:hypothetical protein